MGMPIIVGLVAIVSGKNEVRYRLGRSGCGTVSLAKPR